MAILLRCIYRFNVSPTTEGFLAEIDKLILKFTWKYRGPRIAKTILNKTERLPDFKTYYKEIVVKTA